MTDPTPELVDRVARAIYDLGRYEGAFDHDLRVIDREPRVEAAVWKARARARAAIDAMPQPIGYGVRTGKSGWYGPHVSRTHAEKLAKTLYGGDVTVVALVPTEDQ